MIGQPSTIERAFELAQSGRYAKVSDVKARLKREGFTDNQISGQLYGPTLMKRLGQMCCEARKNG